MDIVWSILFDINKELKKCITVWTRKRKYYLDMKITNVILNELDKFIKCFITICCCVCGAPGPLIRAYWRALDTVFAATFLGR
ncbi:unnamed protein product [Rhizophagus irregularis]|nr:unnamed protein product [Rhizophagus irregularis]CAB4394680.1 unnamed protein product [Rhizophagus irregularis]